MVKISEKNPIYKNENTRYLIKWGNGKEYYISILKYIKHSTNIIDLIEVGDFVNGELVRKIIDDDGYVYLGIAKIICIDESSNIDGGHWYVDYYPEISKIDIETILTKEQYEKNCYKVKE